MDIDPQDIADGRKALRLAGVKVDGLSDEEVVERCVALMNAMVAFAKAIQPIFEEMATGLADAFRRLLPLAELIDQEEAR